jgi:glutathione synthase/RimK-type ligase-like ATP-grasp enzyme
MTKLAVYPYKQGSKSAVALAQALEVKTLKLENSKFRPAPDKILVNWGATTAPNTFLASGMTVLNPPDLLRAASNKRLFFEATLQDPATAPRVPPFTTDKEVARGWFNTDKPVTVFARTVLAGHSGEGIVKVTSLAELEAIPNNTLLCLYVPKRREFRLHVAKTQGLFSVQEKKARLESQVEVDFQIRNLANGFVFARNSLDQVPADAVNQAVKALTMVNLDFGAVDVIWNERKQEAFVLEINTAPGLEGQTVIDYAAMIKRKVNELAN